MRGILKDKVKKNCDEGRLGKNEGEKYEGEVICRGLSESEIGPMKFQFEACSG